MNTPISKLSGAVLLALVMSAAPGTVMHAVAQPSQKPLLSNQSGAKPNLMIALDNSGSMAYPFHEAYGIVLTTDASTALRRCAPPLYANSPVGYTLGGTVDPARPDGQKCLSATGFDASGQPTGYAWSSSNGVAYVPAVNAANSLRAQRSADLNPVYYNPRTTYAPRIGPDYLPLARPLNPRFISNQASSASTATFYTVYRNPLDGALYAVNVQKPAPAPVPAWATSANVVYSLRAYPFPIHVEYTTAGSGTTPAFTYTYCRTTTGTSTVQVTPDGMEVGCSSVRRTPFATSGDGSVVSVFAPGHPSAAGNVIQLPSDHARTDCAAVSSCTNAEELSNILNWYHWYSTRQLATSTAIGQSLASTDFQNNLRIGYMPINDYTLPNGTTGGNTNLAITKTPGTVTNQTTLLRGVRMLQGNTTASTELFSFLNGIQSRGGTPLHNSISQIANYYSVPGAAQENPWSSNPAAQASASNPEMSCRRSFNLLFSDGGWTTSVAPPVGPDYDNTNGPTFSRVRPDGTTENFQYLRTGESTLAGRIMYAPFPSTGTGGLADLTAQFFWHTDLRPALTNGILTRPGQPAFWQNMTTYTVGYLIRPTGEVTGGAGLTFGRIDQYRAEYIANGYAAATKPTWPTGNLVSTSTNQTRVDDFIHAGYTGGGRSFNARSAEDVRRIFDTILSEILGASGNDAGVSTGTSGADNSTLAGRLKYGVTYRTLDNSGEVTAYELDANGDVVGTEWTASTLVPNHTDRRVFTMSDTNTPTDFSGNFSALPADVRNTLKQGPDAARIANDATFVNYLRGMDPARDPSDKLFRQRASKIASIVNAAPLFMGGDYDYGYDLDEGNVEGRDYYLDFTNRKRGYPGSLFVATNAGMVHSLDAETGVEQAVMMPRRSLSRMLHFADEAYDFEYVLDGSITQHDVFDNRLLTAGMAETDKWKAWRHLAMGAGGRGEKLIYAINSPFKPGTTPSRIPDRQDFLWETGPDLIDAADGADVKMGYVSNTFWSGQNEIIGSATDPAIVGSDSDPSLGRWIVAVNNGHYNGNTDGSQAGLIVLDAKTGEVIRTIPLPGAYPAGRGLSGVTLVREYEGHKRVVAAYAGDANGQLWRFNLIGNPSEWHVSYGRPLFTVPGNRPIYGAPAWRNHPQGGLMVVFATGMALEESDIADQGAQSIYAIWDPTTYAGELLSLFDPFTPVAEGDLLSQSVLPATATVKDGITYYSITDNKIDWKIHRGWRLPMGAVHSGERSIADAINVSSSVLISSTVLQTPADPNLEMCTASAQPLNCVYILNGLEASARTSRSFDVIGDGKLDNFSVACIPEGGFSRGVSVVTRFTKTDGTPLPDETPPPPIGPPEDPQKPRDVPGPGTEPPPGSRPPGEGGGPCDEQRIDIFGTGDSSLDGGITCPGSGWSRAQYQLSAPPAK